MISSELRIATLLAILAVPCGATAAIKCWTNKDGVRECGNTVPPEYAQKETRTLNERGVTVDVKARAKTPAELEKERLAKEKEEHQRQRELEQANYDRMLLATFATEDELLGARDRATSAIDATIDVTNVSITTLSQKLDGLKRQAGKRPSKEQQEDIAALERQIKEKQAYVKYKQREKKQLQQKYDGDLKRFRELKALRSQ